jgi:FKBP-type peptidyl-prolyl cis-trans isomerase FkpA
MTMKRATLLLLPILLNSCSPSSAPPDAEASKAYLEKAAAMPGAVRTPSGLIYRELRPGTGTSPLATDSVKVSYRGTLVDGKKFDSSEGIKFALNQVIPCWTEGVQKMRVGGKSELVCPASIAYGDRGQPPDIPGGATLIFEIELLGIG